MKGKKSFVMYCDQEEIFTQLDDATAGRLIKHIYAYVNDKNPQTDDVILKIAFTPFRQQLKRDLLKWNDIRAKRSEAGKASAKARSVKQIEQVLTSVESVEQTLTNSTVNVNVNDNVNDNDKERKKSVRPLWKKDFLTYQQECKEAFGLLKNDIQFKAKIEALHPKLDFLLTLVNLYESYWSTEEGWANKKKKQIQSINWKSTVMNSFNWKETKVYKNDD